MPDCQPQKRGKPAEGVILFDTSNRAPQIPEGEYEAAYVHHETAHIFKTPKLFVWFRIVSPGPAFDVMVYRAYRVRALTSKPGRGGGIAVRRGSDCYRDLCRMLDVKMRPDRASAAALKGIICRVKVRTVTSDYRGREIPDWDRYSVVAELLGNVT